MNRWMNHDLVETRCSEWGTFSNIYELVLGPVPPSWPPRTSLPSAFLSPSSRLPSLPLPYAAVELCILNGLFNAALELIWQLTLIFHSTSSPPVLLQCAHRLSAFLFSAAKYSFITDALFGVGWFPVPPSRHACNPWKGSHLFSWTPADLCFQFYRKVISM